MLVKGATDLTRNSEYKTSDIDIIITSIIIISVVIIISIIVINIVVIFIIFSNPIFIVYIVVLYCNGLSIQYHSYFAIKYLLFDISKIRLVEWDKLVEIHVQIISI